MVELYPESCILVELCIGKVLFGRNVNVSHRRLYVCVCDLGGELEKFQRNNHTKKNKRDLFL